MDFYCPMISDFPNIIPPPPLFFINLKTTQLWLRYDDMLVVPIIENTPEEKDLKDRMARAMEEYPESCAVLVRRHGVYVWGESWQKAKTMWASLHHHPTPSCSSHYVFPTFTMLAVCAGASATTTCSTWPYRWNSAGWNPRRCPRRRRESCDVSSVGIDLIFFLSNGRSTEFNQRSLL